VGTGPNGIIYFDALDIKNVSVKFRLGGDSHSANVVIENYGAELPKALDEPAPGTPVKYIQISAINLSFVEAEISIKYNASELGILMKIHLMYIIMTLLRRHGAY